MTAFSDGLAAAKLQKQIDELQKQIEADRVRRLLAGAATATAKPTAPAPVPTQSTDDLLAEAFSNL